MRRSLFPWLWLGCVLGCVVLLTAPFARAQSEAEPAPEETMSVPGRETALSSDLEPGAQIVAEGRPLSISEAVALSIQNNLRVEVERFAPLIAEADSEGAWGAYDPTVSADMRYQVIKSPNTFALNNASDNRDRVQGGGIGV